MPSRRSLRRFGVQARLLSAFGLLVGLTVSVGGVGWWGIDNIQRSLDRLQRQSIPELAQSMSLMEQSARLVAQAPFVANAKILFHLEEESQRLNERLDSFKQLVGALGDKTARASPARRELDDLAARLETALLNLVEVTRRGIFLDAQMRDRQYRLRQVYEELEQRIIAATGYPQDPTGVAARSLSLIRLLGETHRIAGTLRAAVSAESSETLRSLEARYRQGLQTAQPAVEALTGLPVITTFGALRALGSGAENIFALRQRQFANETERAYLLTASNILSAELGDLVAGIVDQVRRTTETRSAEAAAVLVDSQVRIFVLGAVCLLAALVSASYVIRDLGGNLSAVTHSMLQLVRGDRQSVVPAIDRRDEIGDLARAFDVFRQNLIQLDDTSRQLSDNNRLLEAIIHNMNDGLSVFDAEGRLVAWNSKFRDLYDIPPQAMATLTLGQAIERFLSGADVTIRRLDGRLLDSRQVFSESLQQIEVYRPDERVLELRTSPMPEGGFVTTHTDLSTRKSIEAQLRQAQKMESVGQLTGGLAHDFNNLLTAIIGNLSLLQEKLAQQPELREKALRALEAADRGALITQRLLAFSRKQALRPQPVSANELIEGMLDLLTYSVGDHIAIDLRPEPALWTITIDPGQLENALMNLVLNSRDAMPEGGRLTLCTANRTLDTTNAQRQGLTAGDYVVISVEDTGSGMPADVLGRVFEPFFTTKEVGAGSGLGLSMVYGFIKQSGGQVRIDSVPGSGTTIRLYLPRADETARSPGASRTLSETFAFDPGERTILVVEDDAGVRRAAVDMLQSFGYHTCQAENGRDALAVLDHDARIDLLFTDVVLPGDMNGAELASAAERQHPSLKVLYSSGYTRDELIEGGYLRETIDFLPKPYKKDSLAAKLRAIFEHTPDYSRSTRASR